MTKRVCALALLVGFSIVLTACNLQVVSSSQPSGVLDSHDQPGIQEPADQEIATVTPEPTAADDNQDDYDQVGTTPTDTTPYTLVDTGQTYCFSDSDVIICGESYNGQDAQYEGLQPAYQDNDDGTVTDLNTGLMWLQDPGEKTTYAEAIKTLETYTYAGYDDWRLPTIKELYSLTNFSGLDPSGLSRSNVDGLVPFIDSVVFVFRYGDESGGARVIDSQWLTSNIYGSTVMSGESCFFGFNFADGRIKCYPLERIGSSGGYFALFVRGAENYGENDFQDNRDGTITDQATGLTWTQSDNGDGVLWVEALTYCEGLSLGGSEDWRLPNVKELQSIVDYDRSPDITGSPAIDPIFNLTPITNEAGQTDYAFYWGSTTFISYPDRVSEATYISFGRAMGYMQEFGGWVDVHGAGAQRSDAKSGVPEEQQLGHGPQGDARRSDNYVLCVTGGQGQPSDGQDADSINLPTGSVSQPVGDSGSTSQNLAQGGLLQGPQGSPPPEAIQACSELAVGGSCSFSTPSGVLNGTCLTVPSGELACVPGGNP